MQASKYRRPRSSSLWAVVFAWCFLSACGQKPSFRDETDTKKNGQGSNSQDSIKADGSRKTPGDDSTEGDYTGDDQANDKDSNKDKDDESGDKDADRHDEDTDTSKPNRRTMQREMSFPAQEFSQAEVVKDLDGAYLTQNMTLKREYLNKSLKTNQITRGLGNDQFNQGHGGNNNTEVFDQVANRLLDVLIVMDNSNSMDEEQKRMASKLNPLLGFVGDADWQIAVVTTDTSDGSLRKLIKKTDSDIAKKFADAVTAGIGGDNNERGVLQAVRSLSGLGLPSKWVRDDSNIAVLVVSDEDNCSNATGQPGDGTNQNNCPGKPYAQGSYLYDYLDSVRNPGQNARVYGIIWHPSQSKDDCRTALNQAVVWAKLIDDTQGTWGSICDTDYSATLEKISQNIKSTLNSRFTLKYTPDAGSLRVFVDGAELSSGFSLRGKVVEFATPPAEGAKISISYRYGAQPIQSSFPLTYKPLAGTLAVTVDGQVATTTDYIYNAATQAIDFVVPPVERAKILASYTRDEALQSRFELSSTIKAGSLTVKVNDALVSDYTVNEATGTVTFNAAPAESAKLEFAYIAVGSPILNYAFQAPYGAPVDLYVYDTQTRAPISTLYILGILRFAGFEFVEGRQVTVRYDNIARQTFEVNLPNEPVASSVKATGGSKVCAGSPNVLVSGSVVDVTGCGFADDVMQVKVSYSYIIASYQEFTLALDNLPKAGEYQEWKVFVNGQLSTEYTRAGNIVRFKQPLPVGAVVKIQLIQQVY